MKLIVDKDDIGDIITQLLMYTEDCEHIGIDKCCVTCQAKRIINAWDEDELEIKENGNTN